MRARSALLLLVALLIIPETITAATMYLRDRTTIKCRITRETPEAFEYQRTDYKYSAIYTHDTIKKADVFTVIDDEGVLRFPDDLTLRLVASPEGAMSEVEFQRRSLAMQISAEERMADKLGSIAAVLWLELGIALVAGTLMVLSAD